MRGRCGLIHDEYSVITSYMEQELERIYAYYSIHPLTHKHTQTHSGADVRSPMIKHGSLRACTQIYACVSVRAVSDGDPLGRIWHMCSRTGAFVLFIAQGVVCVCACFRFVCIFKLVRIECQCDNPHFHATEISRSFMRFHTLTPLQSHGCHSSKHSDY